MGIVDTWHISTNSVELNICLASFISCSLKIKDIYIVLRFTLFIHLDALNIKE